jgi:hypothetical protein
VFSDGFGGLVGFDFPGLPQFLPDLYLRIFLMMRSSGR